MSLYISTNSSAVSANYHLGKNRANLQKSMTRLASGNRIIQPADDAGGLAVSMKLQAAINRLSGAEKNIQNAISFLEVQDGVLESVGKIMDRMSELKGLSRDVMKNTNDQATYNNEFKDLQLQLYDMAKGTFNSVSLFARYDNAGGEAKLVIGPNQPDSNYHTLSVFTSAEGSAGAKVSIHKSLLLSALTINTGDLTAVSFANATNTSGNGLETTDFNAALASSAFSDTIDLNDVSVGVFLTALENIAALRAQNGASMSRLNFQAANISRQRANMEAANGRIIDVDMGAESTRMAKYNVLTQASAAMLAQANTTPEVALILLR